MLTVNKLVAQGRGLAPVLLKRAASVELDWDVRCKSRFDATDSAGRTLGVFLQRGQVVRGGDMLVADDGSLVRVNAAPQPLLVVRHCPEHGTPFDLLRAAYHLGNRHVQLELQADRLQLEPDHVLADMLRRMHLIVSEDVAPFEPEAGAYVHAGHGAHAHDGAHTHGHEHAHAGHAPTPRHDAHDHDPDVAHRRAHGQLHPPAQGHMHAQPAAAAPHVHGPGCGHDHGEHGHKH